MTKLWVTACVGALLFATVPLQAAPRELDDAELDAVCAGEASELSPAEGANGNDTIGDLNVNNSINSITLGQNAQQNLTSFVNILAVNSAVQVLMNVNVSINSEVGSVTQGNTGSQAH